MNKRVMRFAASVILVAMMSDVFVVRGMYKTIALNNKPFAQQQQVIHQNQQLRAVNQKMLNDKSVSLDCSSLTEKIKELKKKSIECNSEQDNRSVDDIQNLIKNINDDGTIKINDDEIRIKMQAMLGGYTIAKLYAECANDAGNTGSAAIEMLKILSIKHDVLKVGIYDNKKNLRKLNDTHFNNNFPIANKQLRGDYQKVKDVNKQDIIKDYSTVKNAFEKCINNYNKCDEELKKINALSKIIYCSKEMYISDFKDNIDTVLYFLEDLKKCILSKGIENNNNLLSGRQQELTKLTKTIKDKRNEAYIMETEFPELILEQIKDKNKQRYEEIIEERCRQVNPLSKNNLKKMLETEAEKFGTGITTNDLIVLLNIESEIMQFQAFKDIQELKGGTWFSKMLKENVQMKMYGDYINKISQFIDSQLRYDQNGDYIKWATGKLMEIKSQAQDKIDREKQELLGAKSKKDNLCKSANTLKNEVLDLMAKINEDITKMEKEIGDIECVLARLKEDSCLRKELNLVSTNDMHDKAISLKNKIGQYSDSIQKILDNKEHTTTTIGDSIQKMQKMQNDLSTEYQSYNLQSEIDIAKKNIVKVFIRAECTKKQKDVEENLQTIKGAVDDKNGKKINFSVQGGTTNEYGFHLGMLDRSAAIETMIKETREIISKIEDDISTGIQNSSSDSDFVNQLSTIQNKFDEQKEELRRNHEQLEQNNKKIFETLETLKNNSSSFHVLDKDFQYGKLAEFHVLDKDFQYGKLADYAKKYIGLEDISINSLDNELGDTYQEINALNSKIGEYKKQKQREKELERKKQEKKKEQEQALENLKDDLAQLPNISNQIDSLKNLSGQNKKLIEDIEAINKIVSKDYTESNADTLHATNSTKTTKIYQPEKELSNLQECATVRQETWIEAKQQILIRLQSQKEVIQKEIEAMRNNAQDQQSIEQLNDKINQLKQSIKDVISDRQAQNIGQGIQNDRDKLLGIWRSYVDTQKQELTRGNDVLTELNSQLKEIQESSDDDNSSSKQDFSGKISAIGEKINNLDGKTPTNADDISVQATKGKEAIDKVQDEQAKLKQQIEDAINTAKKKKQEADQKRKEEEKRRQEEKQLKMQAEQRQWQQVLHDLQDKLLDAKSAVEAAKGAYEFANTLLQDRGGAASQDEQEQACGEKRTAIFTGEKNITGNGAEVLRAADKKLKEAEKELEGATQQLQEDKNENNQMNQTSGNPSQQQPKKEQDIQRIKDRLQEAKKKADEVKDLADQAKTIIMNERIDQLMNLINGLSNKVNGLGGEIDGSFNNLDKNLAQLSGLADSMEKLKKDNQEIQGLLQQIKNNQDNELLEKQTMKGKLDDSTKQIMSAINDLVKGINSLTTQSQKQGQDISDLSNVLGDLQNAVQQQISQIQQQHQQCIDDMKTELENIKNNTDGIKASLDAIQKQLDEFGRKIQQQKTDTIKAPLPLDSVDKKLQEQISNFQDDQNTEATSDLIGDDVNLNNKEVKTETGEHNPSHSLPTPNTTDASVDLTLPDDPFQGKIPDVMDNQKTVIHIPQKTPDSIGGQEHCNRGVQTGTGEHKYPTNIVYSQLSIESESIMNNTLVQSQSLKGGSQSGVLSSIIQSQKDIKDEDEPNNNDTLKNIASTLAQKNELQHQLDIMNEINLFITKIKGWSQDDIDISYRDISFDFLDLIKNKKTMVRFVNDSAFAQVVQSMFSNNEGGEASL